jgi:hypothetical protein
VRLGQEGEAGLGFLGRQAPLAEVLEQQPAVALGQQPRRAVERWLEHVPVEQRLGLGGPEAADLQDRRPAVGQAQPLDAVGDRPTLRDFGADGVGDLVVRGPVGRLARAVHRARRATARIEQPAVRPGEVAGRQRPIETAFVSRKL